MILEKCQRSISLDQNVAFVGLISKVTRCLSGAGGVFTTGRGGGGEVAFYWKARLSSGHTEARLHRGRPAIIL